MTEVSRDRELKDVLEDVRHLLFDTHDLQTHEAVMVLTHAKHSAEAKNSLAVESTLRAGQPYIQGGDTVDPSD